MHACKYTRVYFLAMRIGLKCLAYIYNFCIYKGGLGGFSFIVSQDIFFSFSQARPGYFFFCSFQRQIIFFTLFRDRLFFSFKTRDRNFFLENNPGPPPRISNGRPLKDTSYTDHGFAYLLLQMTCCANDILFIKS